MNMKAMLISGIPKVPIDKSLESFFVFAKL